MLNVLHGLVASLERMSGPAGARGLTADLRALRERADEDFAAPPADHAPGRHQQDLTELGLRVSITRSRYPNRPDGVDQYAVTLSRATLDRPPDQADVRLVLETAFGDAFGLAVERSAPGSRVRLFRVPAGEP